MPQSQPALLTPAEAASALRVSPRTLADWVRNGQLACVVLPGGHRRYRRSEIDRIIGTEAAAS